MSDIENFNKKRVTLRDIARYANVSPSTVSRVLNNYPYVDEETRQVVQQVAETLDYPLENLRTTTAARRTISLLARETDQPKSDALAGFDQRAARGAQLALEPLNILTYVRRIQMNPDEAYSLLTEPGSDGFILLGGQTNVTFVQRLKEIGIPFVIAGAHVHPVLTNCVMANYRSGVEAAVEHLVSEGHRHIALVNGPNSTTTSLEKLQSLQLALHSRGLSLNSDLVVNGEFGAESGYEQTQILIKKTIVIDAILYADDHMAMGGLQALKRSGINVPRDVAVIGFHGFEITRYTEPPLTSVEFDMEQMGRIAARRLLMMLDSPDDEDWLTLIPTQLIIRESSRHSGASPKT